MKNRTLATAATALASVAALLVLLGMLGRARQGARPAALAAPAAPTVTEVNPTDGPNDLDTTIVITGSDFVSTPAVYLGDTPLDHASWISTSALTATVPWGMDPGTYTVTVENPGGRSTSLTDAFTVAKGIGVWNAGELYGGAVQGLALNPVTPTTLYATSFSVGLFRSRDGGDNWSFQFASGGGMMHPVVDPHSPNRLYVNGFLGLYRSDDEGDSWTILDTQFPYTDRPGNRCPPAATWIHPYVHPANDTVYAIVCNEFSQGVIKSDDHGQTWESVTEGITDTQVTALAFRPGDADTMYAGTGNGHIFVSSNGGITWTYASRPVECVGALAVNPHASDELWVASDGSFGDPCVLRESTNADLTAWTTLTGTDGCGWPQPSIHFDRKVPGRAFLAGFGFEGLKTTDGGAQWESFGPSGEFNVKDLALHPEHTDTIYVSSGHDGVYRSADGGDSWTSVSRGLTALYPREMQVPPGSPDVIYATLGSSEFFKGTRGGQSWHQLPLSSVESVEIDPVTPTRIYAGKSGDPAYVFMSDDGGQNWTSSAPLLRAPAYPECQSVPYTLLALPEQPGRLLVGVEHDCGPLPHPGNIYRSTDYGEHWRRVYTDTYTNYEMPVDFAAHPLTPTTIYAAISNGEDGLLRSTNSGQTWEPIGEKYEGMAFARSVAVEPAPPYRIFVLTSRESPHLYVSEDAGLEWTEVTALPHPENVEQLLFTDAKSPVLYLYAATRQGGLSRLSIDQEPWEWGPAAGALGQVPIYSLATVTDADRVFLYAGTTGGRVSDTGSETLGTAAYEAATQDTLVNAGVYRYTTRRLRVYLPLVLRSHSP